MQVDISADGRFVSFVSSQDLIGNDPFGGVLAVLPRLADRLPAARLQQHDDVSLVIRRCRTTANTWRISTPRSCPVTRATSSFTTIPKPAAYGRGVQYRQHQQRVLRGRRASSISGNGRYIAFARRALPPCSTAPLSRRSWRSTGTIRAQITVASGDSNGFGDGHSIWPKVSDDGHVLFMTYAGNLTGDFANSQIVALVVRDLQSSALTVASRRPNGTTIAVPSAYAYHAHFRRWHGGGFRGRRIRYVGRHA